MSYPDHFYYIQKSEHNTYSTEPEGQLEVNRLINDKPYWKKPGGCEPQKKLLIITDWMASSWSATQIAEIQKQLRQLLTEGFPLALWQDGQLIALNNENLSVLNELHTRVQITPAYPNQIIQKAHLQYQVVAEQILPLDDIELGRLSDPKYERQLDLSIFHHTPYSQKKIWDLIKRANPPFQKIIQRKFSHTSNQLLLEAKKYFPDIPVVYEYDSLVLQNKALLEELTTKGKIIIDGVEFTSASLPNIHQLKIKNIKLLTSNLLKNLIMQIPQLRCLAIKKIEQIEDGFAEELDLPYLEELTFIDSYKNVSDVNSLLKKTNSLKKININGYFYQKKLDEGVSFSHLETLTTTIPPHNWDNILIHAPQLKTLQLPLDVKIPPNINFNKLHELQLFGGGEQNTQQMTAIINSAPQLKKLKLTTTHFQKAIANELNLPLLEKLTIKNMHFPDLSALLVKTPNLKKLHICSTKIPDITQNCNLNALKELWLTSFPDNIALLLNPKITLRKLKLIIVNNIKPGFSKGLNWSQLEIFESYMSNTSFEDIAYILEQTNQLRTLKLTSMDILNNKFPKNLNCSQLEKLNLARTNISNENLVYLLKQTTHLKTLNLRKVQGLKPGFSKCLNLSQLKHLDLSHSNICLEDLCYLISHAPNLKTLKLEHLKILSPNFTQRITLPIHLQKLVVSHSTLDNSDLVRFIQASKDLSWLTLERCPNIVKNETLDKLLENIPTVYYSPPNTQEEKPQINQAPKHNYMEFIDYEPFPLNAPFTYEGNYDTKSQTMIIGQLSQYLTLTQQHQNFIPNLQDGICNALSQWFMQTPSTSWKAAIEEMKSWNGTLADLTPSLKNTFEEVWKYVQRYQLTLSVERLDFVGNNLSSLLQHRPQQLILKNPWHTITLKSKGAQWEIYDPNHPKGPKQVVDSKLVKVIYASLGPLVYIEKAPFAVIPKLNSPGNFIQEGGLFALFECANWQELLKFAPQAKSLSKEQLSGILLRNLKGMPAWAISVIQKDLLTKYTFSLLEAFIEQHEDYIQALQASLSLITAAQRQELITYLHSLKSISATLRNKLCFVLQTMPQDATPYEQQLQTWEKSKGTELPIKVYHQEVLRGPKKQLIELGSSQEVFALGLSLQQQALDSGHPVFYINKPEDLVCSAPWIKRDGEKGQLMPGPGGALHEFLVKHNQSQMSPVLIVNYDQFKPDDIVGFNALLDEVRYADGTLLPEATQVIGLINPNKPNCYQGSDFYSRFDKMETCPIPAGMLMLAHPPLNIPARDPQIKHYEINLYEAQDWPERLMGRWVMKKNQLVWTEGELEQAFKSGLPIDLQNGLWQDPDFVAFWQQALVQGYIDHSGKRIDLPKTLKLSQSKGYGWKRLTTNTHWDYQPCSTTLVLNPSSLSSFFYAI